MTLRFCVDPHRSGMSAAACDEGLPRGVGDGGNRDQRARTSSWRRRELACRRQLVPVRREPPRADKDLGSSAFIRECQCSTSGLDRKGVCMSSERPDGGGRSPSAATVGRDEEWRVVEEIRWTDTDDQRAAVWGRDEKATVRGDSEGGSVVGPASRAFGTKQKLPEGIERLIEVPHRDDGPGASGRFDRRRERSGYPSAARRWGRSTRARGAGAAGEGSRCESHRSEEGSETSAPETLAHEPSTLCNSLERTTAKEDLDAAVPGPGFASKT